MQETLDQIFDDRYWQYVQERAEYEQHTDFPHIGRLTESAVLGKGFPLPHYMMDVLGIQEPLEVDL